MHAVDYFILPWKLRAEWNCIINIHSDYFCGLTQVLHTWEHRFFFLMVVIFRIIIGKTASAEDCALKCQSLDATAVCVCGHVVLSFSRASCFRPEVTTFFEVRLLGTPKLFKGFLTSSGVPCSKTFKPFSNHTMSKGCSPLFSCFVRLSTLSLSFQHPLVKFDRLFRLDFKNPHLFNYG